MKGYVLAVVGAVSYGLIPLFILPLKSINFPLESTLFYRFSLAALMLLVYICYTKESLKINAKELLYFVLLGLMFAGSSEFLFLGYDHSSPGIASTILFVYPVIVAIIMAAFFREKLARFTIISLLVTTLGVSILSLKGETLEFNFFGVLYSVLSAVCYAVYIVVVNKSKLKASGFKLTFYSLVFTAVYFLFQALTSDNSLAYPSGNVLLEIALFALVTTVISMTALVYAIQSIGSTPASIMGALEPVVAVGISVLMFHEEMTLTLVLGILVILCGVIINIVADSKKSPLH